jgi:peptidoglycan hydrolase-like protein with peptidoglycan-binding domain
MSIRSSVGRGGSNRAEDVRLVQRLLNDALARDGGQLLAVDGIAGPKTDAAIEQYQHRHGLPTDGRMDPSGPTLKHLIDAHLASMVAGMVPLRLVPGDMPPVSLNKDQFASALADYLRNLGNQG